MTHRASTLCALLILCVSASGCVSTSRLITNTYEAAVNRIRTHQEITEVKQETQQQLAKERIEARQIASQREIEQLRAELERQRIEMQFCAANMAAQRQMLQSQVRDEIQSKVAFNASTGIDVGELEVDVEELQKLIEERQKQPPPTPEQPQLGKHVQKGCACGDRACGCEPGLLKKFCRHCKHQPCEEKTCGGPEALQQAMQQQRQPLRPAEIPLKLPVRLTFGLQGPRVEEAQIQQLPRTSPQEQPQIESPQQKGPTQKQPHCINCVNGTCPIHVPYSRESRVGILPPVPEPSAF